MGFFGKGGEKKASPREELRLKIEALASDGAISYALPDTFGGGLAVVHLNPDYPNKGKKFVMSLESLENGKPSGKRRYLWDSNKAKDLADWVMDRLGKPFEG
ncbi:MAG: hypothetical protein PHR43_05565 [Dehalococcoidales bacterium]|nr:hypothetical protein [Dehalococcoidales bacterium]